MSESDCWATAYRFIANGETDRAIELCEQRPCSDVLECQRFLGWTYYQQEAFDKALTWFARAADRGDGDALYGIGSVHFVRRDFYGALQYYERAADHGCSRAYGWIGYIYHQGLGVTRDIDRAISYYKRAAAHGYLVAERALIHLTWQHGNLLKRIAVLPKYLYIIAKAAIIAFRNVNDPRIADVPNAFESKRRSVNPGQTTN